MSVRVVRLLTSSRDAWSKQLEVVEVVAILHDMPLNLAAHRPSDKVFHSAGDEEGRICTRLDANSDVALFDHLDRRLN